MTLEEHLRRCYSHDFPDTPGTIETAEEALVVYRSGYLEGLKDGQHIRGSINELGTVQSKHEFNRGYAQGIAYAAFGASHVALPTMNSHTTTDYVSRLHVANLTRNVITEWPQNAAQSAKNAADGT